MSDLYARLNEVRDAVSALEAAIQGALEAESAAGGKSVSWTFMILNEMQGLSKRLRELSRRATAEAGRR